MSEAQATEPKPEPKAEPCQICGRNRGNPKDDLPKYFLCYGHWEIPPTGRFHGWWKTSDGRFVNILDRVVVQIGEVYNTEGTRLGTDLYDAQGRSVIIKGRQIQNTKRGEEKGWPPQSYGH